MFDQNKFVFDGLKALIDSNANRGYITQWAMSAYSMGTLSTDNMGELQRMLDVRDGILIDYGEAETDIEQSPSVEEIEQNPSVEDIEQNPSVEEIEQAPVEEIEQAPVEEPIEEQEPIS